MMKKIMTVFGLLFISVLMVSVVSADTLFEDDFEGDMSQWDPSSPTSDVYLSDSLSWGDYYLVVKDDKSAIASVDTTGYENIEFSYDRRTFSMGCTDRLRIYWRVGTGSWSSQLEEVSDSSWSTASWSLPSSADDESEIQIRFFLDNGNGDYGLIDDVLVTGDAISQGCSDCDLEILNPLEGEYFSDEIVIDWTAVGNDCGPTYDVFYGLWDVKDGCDLALFDWMAIEFNAQPTVDWDVSGFDESKVCVRIEGDCCDSEIEGPVYIDNIDPTADANGETCVCEGDCCDPVCYDYYTCYEGDSVLLDGSNSEDTGKFPSGIVSWDWSDDGSGYGEFDSSSSGEQVQYNCIDGTHIVDVELEVTDAVGNSGTDTSEVHIINVAPVCQGVSTAETTVPLLYGEAIVDFVASATDVGVNDVLTYTWDFGEGSPVVDGGSISHTYSSAGTYLVSVTVSDGEESVSCGSLNIEVVEPTALDDQEVAAYYPLDADFGNDAGQGWRSFENGLTGLSSDDCEIVIGPENMRTRSFDEGECRVRWDNDQPPHHGLTENPTNDEQGNHYVVIKVSNGTDYEYFSFNVMVYSWIIDLNEGWNLVSIPYVPASSDINDVGIGVSQIKGELNSIWSYEYDSSGDSSEWKCRKTTSGGSWSSSYCADTSTKLEQIVPGRGYWLKMDEAAQLKGFGTQIAQNGGPGMPPEIDVPANGWSLIGRYGILGRNGEFEGETPWDAGGISVSTAMESLTMGRDNELHVFDVDEDAHLVDVSKLFNNEGYWLWIEDENFGDHDDYGYAPLDKYYREDLSSCHECQFI